MNQTSQMNWLAFKEQLLRNPDLHLQFQYGEGKRVDASYHITEIKQAPITSVDCGGTMNSWTEVIVQLWEPGITQGKRAMKVHKALSIIDIVEKQLPLNPDGTVKIEFGNSLFETRQMLPAMVSEEGDNLVVGLVADVTQCKAKEACGIPENVTSAGSGCCEPGSGCC